MTKTLNQFFFFPSTKIRIFFSATLGIRIFFWKKTITPPFKLNGHSLNEQVTPILTSIFAKSLKSGEISKDWKHANVVPAFKKGERYKAVNYRPISLTCICCKIMEHIMTYLENNNILYDLQHGFRDSRSCES